MIFVIGFPVETVYLDHKYHPLLEFALLSFRECFVRNIDIGLLNRDSNFWHWVGFWVEEKLISGVFAMSGNSIEGFGGNNFYIPDLY